MKFNFINESPLSYLSRLDESIMPVVEDTEVLYEDNDYSKTPAEADDKRSTAEDVLGFELDGNQVQWLADNFKAFYDNAEKYSKMKDMIIEAMSDEGLVSSEQLSQSDDSEYLDDEYNDEPIEDLPEDKETLEDPEYDDDFSLEFEDGELDRMKGMDMPPVQQSNYTSPELGEAPRAQSDEPISTQQELDDIANSTVPDDFDDDLDPAAVEKILMGSDK